MEIGPSRHGRPALLRRHLCQHLDVLVSVGQFVLETSDLFPELIDQFDFRVDVLGRLIRDKRSFHGIIQR